MRGTGVDLPLEVELLARELTERIGDNRGWITTGGRDSCGDGGRGSGGRWGKHHGRHRLGRGSRRARHGGDADDDRPPRCVHDTHAEGL